MASTGYSKNSTTANLTLALAAVSASAAIFVATYIWRRKWGDVQSKIRELEKSLNSALEKYTAERQGRVRAQQALRKALAQPKSANSGSTSYPMRPIGVVQSCFSTRNGTPRQPLLVPLARACLIFDPTMVPPASLEGLEEYSHCWIVYVFHLNTDLEKLWKPPSNSKFKAKVRVPRLKGGRMGVFATRSPHRPCPIGLTVAKVEAVLGQMVLLSGVDLVDGTPVLDIKPYLPYCDSIQGATVPSWVTIDNMLAVASVSFSEGFTSSLADCWKKVEKKSLYASPHELKSLVEQVLSWDIRSISQRNRPHNAPMKVGNVNGNTLDNSSDFDDNPDEEAPGNKSSSACPSRDIIYHLILEGMDVSYRIDCNGNIIVETIVVSPKTQNGTRSHSSYHTWSKKLG